MPGLLKTAVYITIGIILFFILRKKERKPSRFDMGLSKHRKSGVNKNALTGLRKVTPEVVEEGTALNVDLITFEGRKYSVWQVLGVPSGASEKEIKAAYANKANELSGKERELVFKAYKKALSVNEA